MTADEARRLNMAMRQLGIGGVPAPVNPEDPSGSWRVYDDADPLTRQDITHWVRSAVAARTDRPATRGFVIPV
ncbi:hypothetical protein ACFWBC_29080 [Streptomyces sp. NPDC059985]|uniref:hypothetical protein n=1 Tax=Streptomyces sp. NPDC059985 TaxID=3347025 RepID=UPI0036A43200